MEYCKEIFERSLEYLYGRGVTLHFPWDNLVFIRSKSSKKIKHVKYRDETFATVKENGVITLSILCAQFMLKSDRFWENCVKASEEAEEFVKKGGNLFCKHVQFAGKNIRAGLDVGILNKTDELIGVGKLLLPRSYILTLRRGVAVETRRGAS